MGLIAATILVIPIFTNIVSAGLERFYGVIAGNEGRIAARNMKDNKNTTQNITLLFISISAIIAISVVGNFVTTYISDVFHGAELQGFADGRMEPEFVEQVEEIEGIDKVLPVYVFENTIKQEVPHSPDWRGQTIWSGIVPCWLLIIQILVSLNKLQFLFSAKNAQSF